MADKNITHWKNLSLEPIVEVIEEITYTEEWKDIPNYEGLYAASTMGRIMMYDRIYVNKNGTNRLFKKRIVAQTMNPWGYVYVELANKNIERYKRFVHVLTALTFIPNPLKLPEVNHLYGIKHDCRVTQLEWSTKSDNHKHAYRVLLKKANKTALGKKGGLSAHAVPVNQYTKTGEFIKTWPSQSDAARELNINAGNISSCCIGTYKSTGGFIFKYLNQ